MTYGNQHGLLTEVVKEGRKITLDRDETKKTHLQFATEYKSSIEKIRASREVSFENLKNIVVR